MRIGLTYDLQTDPADERQAEFDPPRTLDALEAALRQLGHTVIRLGDATELLAASARLRDVDLVWNLAEGDGGRCREAWVPTLLELWGVPFVGSDALALAIGLDKLLCKQLARSSGVVTPRWVEICDPNCLDGVEALRFPLIIKPRYEGSGLGVDAQALVHDLPSLRRRARWAIERFAQPCLAEEFVAFGELTVLLIGNQPPVALPVVQRPLDAASRLACHVARQGDGATWIAPLELTPALEHAARGAAVAMFELLGCRDMARVDFRVDQDGQPFFLEINPLPSFDPEGTLGLLAESLGTTYTHLVGRILEAAGRRRQPPMCAAVA